MFWRTVLHKFNTDLNNVQYTESSITALHLPKLSIQRAVLIISFFQNVKYRGQYYFPLYFSMFNKECSIYLLRPPYCAVLRIKSVKFIINLCVCAQSGDLPNEDIFISSLSPAPGWCRQRK